MCFVGNNFIGEFERKLRRRVNCLFEFQVARSARVFDRSMDKDWLTKADLPYEEAKKSKQRRPFEMSFASFCFRFLTNIVENHKFIDHRRLYHLDRRSQVHRVDRVANTLQIRDSSEIMMSDFIIYYEISFAFVKNFQFFFSHSFVRLI